MNELSIKALRSFAGVGEIDLWSPRTALLIVDMQVSCIRPHGFSLRRLRERGLDAAAAQYEAQVAVATRNLARVLDRVRTNRQPVFFTVAVRSAGRQPGGWVRTVDPADADGEAVIEELAPRAGETVVPKAASGVFASTNLDYMLRRREITSLIVGGVVTNGCVEHAITHGHDLGYACVLLSDGSAALTDEIHENTLERLEHRRAHVLPTGAVLDMRIVPATSSV